MRCSRCGNENPETNRFCGMCGTTLLQATASSVAAAKGHPPSSGPAQPVSGSPLRQEAQRSVAPSESDSAVIAGPSFLGLNRPASAPSPSPALSRSARRRASLSIDPDHSGPGNLDYLLDDEEPSKGGGGWKFLLVLIALALAVGFGYLRWKHGGFDWLTASAKKPAATSPSESQDSGTPPAPAPSTTTPVSPAQTPPAQDANPTASPQPNASTNPAPAATAANPPAGDSGTAPAQNANPTSAPPSTPPESDTATKAAESAPEDATPPATKKTTAKAVPPPARKEKAKPSAAARTKVAPPAPAKTESVAEAQKYLYGRGGERQDCDRGLRMLKPSAEEGDPKAMIEMGALYSAGLCTPRDLPTAYRWFALALRKDPENQSVQTDLQKLWGEMTQPERQLAIRLSQ